MAEESMKDYEKEINESLERQKKIETEEDLGWDRLSAAYLLQPKIFKTEILKNF